MNELVWVFLSKMIVSVGVIIIIFQTFDVFVVKTLVFDTRLFIQMALVVVSRWEAELTNWTSDAYLISLRYPKVNVLLLVVVLHVYIQQTKSWKANSILTNFAVIFSRCSWISALRANEQFFRRFFCRLLGRFFWRRRSRSKRCIKRSYSHFRKFWDLDWGHRGVDGGGGRSAVLGRRRFESIR